MAASIIQSSQPGQRWWTTRTHKRARNITIVIGPKTHATTVMAFDFVSGLTVFGGGQLKRTSMGGCMPPGIVTNGVARGTAKACRR